MAPPHQERAPRPPEPRSPPPGKPSLQERLAAMAARHGGIMPEDDPPEPEGPPPTDAEALATLQDAFPDATVETIPRNG